MPTLTQNFDLQNYSPYFFALGSNLAFGTASVFFTLLSKKHSPVWINAVKASIAFVGFFICTLFFESFYRLPAQPLALALLSGVMGLFIADYFLFKAFSTLGASRTLMIYSFQPILLGVYGYIFLNQTVNFYQSLSILFMMSCVYIIALERKKKLGHWDLRSFVWALLAIFFDALGIMLTRSAFEAVPQVGSFEMNLIRALGAILGTLFFVPKTFIIIRNDFMRMTRSQVSRVIFFCTLGTFVSLSLYLQALKHAHVATLTGISITGPIWASLFEHLSQKQFPNFYLLLTMALFFSGFALMILGVHS